MTGLVLERLPEENPDRPAETPGTRYDLLFVGAGASTSYVLRALLGALAEQPAAAPLHIGVVERDPDPFGGIAYGGRAARTSLLITPLRDFLPDEEREAFAGWLRQNRGWVFDEFRAARGPFSQRWWSRHRDQVERGDFDALYLPRYVFGAYLAERTREAVAAAAAAGTATTDVLHDEVVAVAPSGGGYEVRCRDQVLLADRIVLATGSPPVLARLHLADDVAPGAQTGGLVDDPFAGMAAAVDRVRDAVRRAGDRHRPHVVLIGGNAGTMDMLYQLNDVDAPELQEAVFTVLSPRGELPACVADGDPVPAPFTPEHLDALADAEQIAAAAVYRAALADIERGRDAGLSAADTLRPISQAVGRLLPRLSPTEALEFAGRWGNELGRYQRRAGWEYYEVVDDLTAAGRFHLLSGSFLGLRDAGGGAFHVQLASRGEVRELDLPAAAVVNCAGPAKELNQTGSALLGQLVDGGVCRAAPFGGGIEVDTSLAAAPGLYVMGPLLAGNLVHGAPLWHMEHCGRISTYGTAFGRELARDLQTG